MASTTAPSLRAAALPLVVLLTVLLAFAAFGRSLFQGFAPVDDPFLIVRNLATHGIRAESLRLAFTTFDPELYIPLTLVSFQVNYLISELAPWSYHVVNILLHAANAVLVMMLVDNLMRANKARTANTYASRETETSMPYLPSFPYLPFLTGLLFAVHPLHTEAVAWLAGRKDLLSTFFALLSITAYLRYRDGWKPRLSFMLSLVTFLFALLSKVSVVTLPVILLLIDVLLERRKDRRAMIVEKIPFLLLSAAFLVIALFGKKRIIGHTGALETVLMAGRSTTFYLWKLIFPVGLSVFYPQQGPITLADPKFLFALFSLFALLALIVWSWKHHKTLALSLGFFLVALAPTLPHFRRAGAVYFAVDRYAYFPSIGIFLLLALAIDRFLGDRRPRLGFWIPAGAVIALAIALSIRQTFVWDSPTTLFGNALRLYPASVEARVNLARMLRGEKKYQEAFELLRGGLRYGDDVRLYLNAGYLYADAGNLGKAHEQFQKARELYPADPNPLFDLASLARQTGNPEEAMRLYRAVIEMDPSFVIARVQLAGMLRDRKDAAGAEAQLIEAIRWHPNAVDAHLALASLLLEQDRRPDALSHVRTALRIDPENDEARRLLASIRETARGT